MQLKINLLIASLLFISIPYTMMQFIGHFHPVIVHMPIGIMLLGGFLLFYQGPQLNKFDKVISLAFLVGSISATLACFTGWLLAQSGEFDSVLIQKHQWVGIATAAIGWTIYFNKYKKVLAISLVVLIIITGHLGTTLTHGENYLFSSNKEENIEQINIIVAKKNETVLKSKDSIKIVSYNVYKEEIKPILQVRCYNCHGPLKQKGGLRLDSESFIKKGGKEDIVLVVNNPLKSKMYTNLVLPMEDDKHMPPKGKHQLTNQEITTIKQWIANGASFEDKIDTITNSLKESTADSVHLMEINKVKAVATKLLSVVKENMPIAINNATIELFKNKNIILTSLGEGSNFIVANFINAVPFNSEDIADLKLIKNQLSVLKLSNLPIKDSDIKIISNFKNITRLNLENTAITDESITYLNQLPKLEQLNLYGTNITDESLKQLSMYKNLSVLYFWKTKVTKAGIENFVKIKPNVKIEMGDFKFQKK